MLRTGKVLAQINFELYRSVLLIYKNQGVAILVGSPEGQLLGVNEFLLIAAIAQSVAIQADACQVTDFGK